MPKSHSTRKRRFRRRRRYPRNTATNTGIVTPLGRKFRSTLKYADTARLLTGVGSTRFRVLSCNGMFDPDITGTGHQPMGFDQLTTFYDHYCVIMCKGRFTYTNLTSTPVVVGVVISDVSTTTALTSTDQVMEQPSVKWMVLAPSGNADATKSMSLMCNPNKYLSVGSPLSNALVNGNALQNPAEQVFFHVFASPLNSGDLAYSVDVAYQLDYTAIFHEPRATLSQS